MQLKIVVLSGGGKKWCFDRLESDMMIFCEWLVEGVKYYYSYDLLIIGEYILNTSVFNTLFKSSKSNASELEPK